MTPPQTKPRTRLTNADYMRLTPPVPDGPRYQLINGELVKKLNRTAGRPCATISVGAEYPAALPPTPQPCPRHHTPGGRRPTHPIACS